MENNYKDLRELTPESMQCALGACPSTHEATRDERRVYLVVGKLVNPSDAGLEAKVGEGEALIEVPRALIDKKQR